MGLGLMNDLYMSGAKLTDFHLVKVANIQSIYVHFKKASLNITLLVFTCVDFAHRGQEQLKGVLHTQGKMMLIS